MALPVDPEEWRLAGGECPRHVAALFSVRVILKSSRNVEPTIQRRFSNTTHNIRYSMPLVFAAFHSERSKIRKSGCFQVNAFKIMSIRRAAMARKAAANL